MYRCLILCHRYYANTASFQTSSLTSEVVNLFKALSESGHHPQLMECIERTARNLALHSQHRDALTLLHEVEHIKVCYLLATTITFGECVVLYVEFGISEESV